MRISIHFRRARASLCRRRGRRASCRGGRSATQGPRQPSPRSIRPCRPSPEAWEDATESLDEQGSRGLDSLQWRSWIKFSIETCCERQRKSELRAIRSAPSPPCEKWNAELSALIPAHPRDRRISETTHRLLIRVPYTAFELQRNPRTHKHVTSTLVVE